MNGNYSRFIKGILVSGDLLMINISFALGYLIKFKSFSNLSSDKYFALFLAFNTAWIIATAILKTYEKDRLLLLDKMAIKMVRVFFLHTLLITAFWVVRKTFYYSREQLMWTFLILYPLIFIWRGILSAAIKEYRKKGFNFKKIIVAGTGDLASEFIQILHSNNNYGYKLIGVFGESNKISSHETMPIKDLEKHCLDNSIDEIYCSISDLETGQVRKITQFADNNLIRIKMIPDVRGFANKRLDIDFIEYMPILSFRNLPLDDTFNGFIKRVFDIIFSLLIIIGILSWLYPLIALLIKLDSKGPVLFKQKRSGENNQDFYCLKFRSMENNRDSDTKQAIKNDARITKVGKFIRRTSIDEMPQFFNVLKGDMSIVGPRPHMLKHTLEYSRLIDKYMIRHFVKPGITGLAQIKGFRGETTDPKMMENRIKMDMLYVESWTFPQDLWIIFRTVFSLFKKDNNAY